MTTTTTVISHPSLLPLNGGINFRDLGNRTLSNGSKIKSGLLFRSGSLDMLTDNDQIFLAEQNLFQIIDYRDSSEIIDRPDQVWSGASYHHAPANPLSKEVDANFDKLSHEALEQFDAKDFMLRLYQLLPINNPAYKTLASLLLQPEKGGIVQHCAVGKDRTGIGSALVLFALGADLDTVMEDYLVTNITLTSFREYLLNKYAKSMSDSLVEKMSYVFSVREEFLMTALNSINQHYGSVDIWLEKDVGLDMAAREKLQNYFLE
ncbi:tyrosine-protein phosphatase [Xenorhabdus sp. KK7.4]|uniref:tyrosine-protein phosphatase n=1 Tax=Xenorhabdus sp. KK7.4 TaxID=1851572 RepID=UPI000C056978|nr:tyrosine-protein phosphatase [Xenorhabdus sp. KK7.4]PHM53794.1 phosphotyrosine protein phosphatase [Xenorhabdus sp. KK7.4]